VEAVYVSAGNAMKTTAATAFLYREARLLDTWQLDEWLTLFTHDGIYWVPIDDAKPATRNTAIIHDTPLRREERVFHLMNHRFASQTPRSRTIHIISNVESEATTNDEFLLRSNQVIYEVRTGDFRQNGLGEVRPLIATVEHLVRPDGATIKIVSKKVLLIDRDMVQRNLTFIV
jgi:ethylbenzene dioxygenase subunit beta